eukprot:587_1
MTAFSFAAFLIITAEIALARVGLFINVTAETIAQGEALLSQIAVRSYKRGKHNHETPIECITGNEWIRLNDPTVETGQDSSGNYHIFIPWNNRQSDLVRIAAVEFVSCTSESEFELSGVIAQTYTENIPITFPVDKCNGTGNNVVIYGPDCVFCMCLKDKGVFDHYDLNYDGWDFDCNLPIDQQNKREKKERHERWKAKKEKGQQQ